MNKKLEEILEIECRKAGVKVSQITLGKVAVLDLMQKAFAAGQEELEQVKIQTQETLELANRVKADLGTTKAELVRLGGAKNSAEQKLIEMYDIIQSLRNELPKKEQKGRQEVFTFWPCETLRPPENKTCLEDITRPVCKRCKLAKKFGVK